MLVGDKVKVIERTVDGDYEWDGEVMQVNDSFVETRHQRNIKTHPQWIRQYPMSYVPIYIKHYRKLDGSLPNVKII